MDSATKLGNLYEHEALSPLKQELEVARLGSNRGGSIFNSSGLPDELDHLKNASHCG